MRISDWSSDVCSSDLTAPARPASTGDQRSDAPHGALGNIAFDSGEAEQRRRAGAPGELVDKRRDIPRLRIIVERGADGLGRQRIDLRCGKPHRLDPETRLYPVDAQLEENGRATV